MTAHLAPARATTHLTTTVVAALRRSLAAELVGQEALALELHQTADQLTGQQDTDSILEREVAGHGVARCIETAAEVQLALRRLDDGTYGACERCGQDISIARLEVIPYTRHCVGCPAPSTLIG